MAVASPSLLRPLYFAKSHSPQRLNLYSRFLSPIHFSGLQQSTLSLRSKPFSLSSSRRLIASKAAQDNILKVIQTAWKIGKDGVEAGTNLVPGSIPRPIARVVVTGALVSLALALFSTILSTAFFVLALMGVVYFLYITFNNDEGPRGGGGDPLNDEETLDEARRIMDKYK